MSHRPDHLSKATVRLFADDIRTLKKVAAERRSKWQIELRQLVHRALAGETREFTILKERS